MYFALVALAGCSESGPEPSQEASSATGQSKADEEARETNPGLFAKRLSKPGKGLTKVEERAALKSFRRVWSEHKPVFKSSFMGVRTLQNPLDAWVVQEVLFEVAPEVMIETGTAHGGSSLLWAMILREIEPDARIITIDIEDRRNERAREHALAKNHVDFLLGDSVAPRIVDDVRRRVAGKRVLVLLDSLHTGEHIAKELAAYAPMVSVGSYLIVQDTPLGGVKAIKEFLAANDHFVVDRSRERFVLTNSVHGYLKRVR